MKKIENLILLCAGMMLAGLQALYAQANDAVLPEPGDKNASDYLWIAAVAVVIVGIIAAVIYQRRHRRDKQSTLTGDINNPASGI